MIADLHSLKPDKQPLIVNQRPAIPITEFINTICTANQNKYDSQGQKRNKNLKRHRQRCFPLLTTFCPHISDRIIHRKSDKNDKRKDLERKSSFRYIHSDIARSRGGGRQRTTNGLKAQRENVTRNKDPVIQLWREPPVVRTEIYDAITPISSTPFFPTKKIPTYIFDNVT